MLELFNIPHLITTYGYPGIFIIVFLESGIFFPLPGDSLLFTAGLFAGAYGLNIYFLIPMIFVATFTGGMLGYFVGERLLIFQNTAFGRKFLKKEYVNKAHAFFEQYGAVAVVFCRFVPIVRTFVPIVAGVAKMDYNKFVKYSLFGSLLWSAGMTLLGFFLGRIFPGIKEYLWVVVLLVIFVSLLPIIFEYIRKARH